MQNLYDLLRETDALTYINALKVTLVQIKDEISEQDELREHLNASSERTKKYMRKADNQYRLIAKLVTSAESPLADDITIDEDLALSELRELMEND